MRGMSKDDILWYYVDARVQLRSTMKKTGLHHGLVQYPPLHRLEILLMLCGFAPPRYGPMGPMGYGLWAMGDGLKKD